MLRVVSITSCLIEVIGIKLRRDAKTFFKFDELKSNTKKALIKKVKTCDNAQLVEDESGFCYEFKEGATILFENSFLAKGDLLQGICNNDYILVYGDE